MVKKILAKIRFEINKENVLRKRRALLNKIEETSFTLFMVPNQDTINGGILSITSIVMELEKLQNMHKSKLLVLNHKYNPTDHFLKFTQFKNDLYIFDWKSFLDNVDKISSLTLHIPELFLETFIEELRHEWSDNHLKKIRNLNGFSVNILNQNDLLMPSPEVIEWIKSNLTTSVTMTMAHKQYATPANRIKYGVPMHYLSAWLNPEPYRVNTFVDKKKIIMFSPDELSRAHIKSEYTKQDLINKLSAGLPDFEIRTVQNMKYEEYKDLAAISMFTVTLGEGLDGYFLDTVLSGGITFAVYNEEFFTSDYQHLKTVYPSFEKMLENIVDDIKLFQTQSLYDSYSSEQKKVLDIEYSFEKYQKRVLNFIQGIYDLP